MLSFLKTHFSFALYTLFIYKTDKKTPPKTLYGFSGVFFQKETLAG